MYFASLPTECSPSQYQELNEADRYWNASVKPYLACDKNFSTHGAWYRFTGAAGSMMAPYCIPKKSCITHGAGWIVLMIMLIDETVVNWSTWEQSQRESYARLGTKKKINSALSLEYDLIFVHNYTALIWNNFLNYIFRRKGRMSNI